MFTTAAVSMMLMLAQGTGTDTTVSVRQGTRLEINSHRGDLVVRTWDRDALRVQATHSGREYVEIKVAGAVVSVAGRSRRGAPRSIDFEITAPAWMDLNLSGTHADISVTGSRGRVTVRTVQGDATVRGGRGLVTVSSVQGDLVISEASGRIELNTVNGEITVRDVEGEVQGETVNGDIRMSGVRSESVSLTTVNGDLDYAGSIRDGGRYRFATHNGDVSVRVPAGANVTVDVATFQGEFESAFPVTLTQTTRGRRFSFTIGSGSARLELESFQGRIRLLRP